MTVTLWSPAVVVMMELDEDTLLTVPAPPHGAGPDRALDPSEAEPAVVRRTADPEGSSGRTAADVIPGGCGGPRSERNLSG